jgi:enterochelin esterase-like enzyme
VDATPPTHGTDSYPKPGVPQGTLSEKLTHTSQIYDGMQSDYWVYVPSQYNPQTPAALMVWQDGHFYIDRDSPTLRVLDVIDNLTHQKQIPVMIQIFTSPGDIAMCPGTPTHAYVKAYSEATGRTLKDAMRSTQYDTVSDRYACFLHEELLAEVQSRYNIRPDGYSRGISGLSSGAIAAFNVAWWQPGQFSRVLSWIGSYGDIRGGHEYPFKVRKQEKRNIRVWLQDGSDDVEVVFGSWPLQNIQMANSLKMHEYDFHFSFGQGGHDSVHGSAELPQSLTWLWRDYDSAKTEQLYQMEEAEKSKPYFRVRIANRE